MVPYKPAKFGAPVSFGYRGIKGQSFEFDLEFQGHVTQDFDQTLPFI
jgi:hypothetical protein